MLMLATVRRRLCPPLLLQVIDTDVYEVCVVSPRNHFLFTPMLPA